MLTLHSPLSLVSQLFNPKHSVTKTKGLLSVFKFIWTHTQAFAIIFSYLEGLLRFVLRESQFQNFYNGGSECKVKHDATTIQVKPKLKHVNLLFYSNKVIYLLFCPTWYNRLLKAPHKRRQAGGILLTATLSSTPTQYHLQKGFCVCVCMCVNVYVCVCVISQSGVTLKVMHKQLFILTFRRSCFYLNVRHTFFTSWDKRNRGVISAVILSTAALLPTVSIEDIKAGVGSKGRIDKKRQCSSLPWKAQLCCVLHVCVQWWDVLLTYCIRWSLCFMLTL